MCNIRYPKFILDIVNTFGVKTDVFIKNPAFGSININFMGERLDISGNGRGMHPPAVFFREIYSSPETITNYYIGKAYYGNYKAICRNAVYLEINGTVYIDRR